MDWTQRLEQCRLYCLTVTDAGLPQSLPPHNAEITQELKCLELCWSLESNYLLFSDKFRVNHIFFKEKQAVVSGGSRDQHQHWFSRVRRLICITRNPKQEFLEFLQQYLQPSFPFVLGVKELCSHSQLQATGTEQGWQSLSKVSVRVPAAPGCGLQVQVLCQAQGVLDRSWPLLGRDPVRMCKGHNRAETAHESHLRPLVNVFAAQEHACDSFSSLTQLTLALAVMFCQCLPWSHTCVSRNELLSPSYPPVTFYHAQQYTEVREKPPGCLGVP